MSQFNTRAVLLLTFCLPAAIAASQPEDSLQQKKMLEPETLSRQLEPVEVRSVRAGALTPFTKSTLTGKMIREENFGQDIPYLLQYTPSAVSTSDAGAGIGYTGLRVRGTEGTRINVTLNGIPVNDAESQGTFFVNTPDLASSTGSIQLQRGVGTSTNGGGAFGATLSISNLDQMQEAGIEVYNTYGSYNTWKHTLKAGTGLLKNGFQFDVRLSKITSDGYRDRSAADLKAVQLIAGWKIHPKGSLRFMMMSGQERTGQAWNGVHQAQLENNQEEKERHYAHNAGSMYYTAQDSTSFFYGDPRRYNYFTYKNQTDNYAQNYYQLFYDQAIGSRLSLHLAGFLTRGKGYYEEYRNQEKYSSYGLPDFITPSGSDTLRRTDLIRQLWLDNYFFGSVFSLIYQADKTELTIGGAVTRYTGDHLGYIKWADYGIAYDHQWYLLPAWKNDGNFYIKAQHFLNPKWILFGDLQYRTVHHRIEGFRKNPDIRVNALYHFFNPKAGITWVIQNTSASRQQAYASLAIANREPNRDDFEASPVSLPKPERLYNLEAGYSWQTKTSTLSGNFYYMHYENQLIMTGKINDVGAYTRTNVAESYRMGIELEGRTRLASWITAGGNANLSQNKIRHFTSYTDNWDSGEQDAIAHGTTDIAFSPAVTGAAALTFTPFPLSPKGKGLTVELLEKYVGKQYLDNTSNESRIIKPYYTTDLRIRYAKAMHPFREISVMLGVQNLFDLKYVNNGYTYAYRYEGKAYTDNYYYPQAGRNWFLAVGLQW